jgi:hypothetical protein
MAGDVIMDDRWRSKGRRWNSVGVGACYLIMAWMTDEPKPWISWVSLANFIFSFLWRLEYSQFRAVGEGMKVCATPRPLRKYGILITIIW